ncbi:MAG: Mur ligase domain-containing protein [Methylococcaceae bacterium]
MRMHIMGVATTFMTGLAVLARQEGHEVSASDSCINIPIRVTLETAGVKFYEGFSSDNLASNLELVIIGTDLHLNNSELLEVHRRAIPFVSGATWLSEYVLHDKWTKNMLQNSVDESPKQPAKPSRKPPPDAPNSKLKQRIVR